MEWWVFESRDMLPGGIATVHRSDCKFHARNQGRSEGEPEHDGLWLGPFTNIDDAAAAAKATGARFISPCWFCG